MLGEQITDVQLTKQKKDVRDARVIAVRWEPQEEGVMSTMASFPSVRNQGLIDQ